MNKTWIYGLVLLMIAGMALATSNECPVSATCQAGNADTECACFGYDFGITKYDVDTNSYEGGSEASEFVINVAENANFDWTADPGVAGVLVKTGGSEKSEHRFCELPGDSNGIVNLTYGQYGTSHITFCGYHSGGGGCNPATECCYTGAPGCPPDNGVPEFSTMALGAAIIGVGLGLALLRKHK